MIVKETTKVCHNGRFSRLLAPSLIVENASGRTTGRPLLAKQITRMNEERGLYHLMGHRERETIERELSVSFADIYDRIDDAIFETSELEKMLRRLFRGESPGAVAAVR